MIINDLDGYYIVFDTKNWNTELDTLSYYSSVMSSAWMMDEGMFCIDYAMMGTIIFADFTTEATTVTEDNHLYTNAKITWKLKQQKLLYRANIY